MNERLFALLLVLTAGCGDPLTDAAYRGAPILKLDGQITTRGLLSADLLDSDFAVSLFWAPDNSAPKLVEQSSVTTDVRFPSAFELRVFEPPTDTHFGDADAAWVVGLVLVYSDANVDARYEPNSDDEFVGGSLFRGLVYARSDIEASDAPHGQALSAGFNVVDLPFARECKSLKRRSPGGGPSQNGFNPMVQACAEGCRPGFVCDEREGVCAPDETFNLLIDPEFALAHAICR